MTHTSRRQVLLAALATTALGARAQSDFPQRPIKVIVPYAAGGADTYIRPLQAGLEKHHMTLVIESVVGAGGTVGANRVKRSPADGYTLLFCGSGALTIAAKQQNDGLAIADFAQILNLVTIPYFVATKKDSPIKNGADFVRYVRENPGKLTYGSPGIGSAPHLGMEAMAAQLGSSVTHVPFSGIATAVQSILGGHIDAVIGAASSVMPQVKAGQLNIIGVTSRERFPLAKEVPTMAEAGLPSEITTNFGFHAPKGTPQAVLDKIAFAVRDAARDPAFGPALEALQTQVNVLDAAGFSRALAAESAYFDTVIAKLPKQ